MYIALESEPFCSVLQDKEKEKRQVAILYSRPGQQKDCLRRRGYEEMLDFHAFAG
jgi:hypothetical protein